MAMVELSLFLGYVLPFAPGCPQHTAERALRSAAIEWCERTNGWRSISSFDLTENRQAIVTPEHAVIHKIEEATFDGEPLTPTLFTEAAPDELTGEAETGEPRYLTQVGPNEVSVYPFAPGLLRLSLFLKPREDSLFGTDPDDPLKDAYNVVPDFMLSQHAERLSFGALARLLAMPNQTFTNPQEAQRYRLMFDAACDGTSSASIKGQQRARLRIKPQWL
ncbi:hypothetical protein EYE35_01130 [Cereibacter sphaeroides]|nr:hypothetical protein EYE35_01130 [Cereibacter sphaeroides]RDS95570.1 hypothetical protein DWF04_06060 [Cereibacter sphaeroides f. sp. denitrificans]